ncbi:type 1 glutamine amidotransferase domain-containing protein [Gracilimonas mengyeensis]|uniref:Protease I n=1 Tax=Gracilimonas mengyeensis TaxID=1302730 RepID=A0A521EA20_9BACT|nr:type 1 glutamine amidotransferase domain-containing protein [Gracilimonas mengyeensis]SMO80759.1 protease I [Gracilimonas mengyeensis]
MSNELNGKKVAILATNGFEEVELTNPREALHEAGAETHIISPESGSIKSWATDQWGDDFDVDVALENASAEEYDSLLLPGGVLNPDQLRMNDDAIEFVRSFFKDGKPVAAICHGPQILIDAEVLQGRELTSYPSIKNDLKNAGARWVDNEVVVDQGLTTSRTPDDLPAFNSKMIEEIREGVHAEQMTA